MPLPATPGLRRVIEISRGRLTSPLKFPAGLDAKDTLPEAASPHAATTASNRSDLMVGLRVRLR